MESNHRKDPYFKRHHIKIIGAKNAVMRGIQLLSYCLNTDKFTIAKHCVEDAEEFSVYSWDPKAADKGQDEVIKQDDHCMDRNRYAVMTDSILFKTKKNCRR